MSDDPLITVSLAATIVASFVANNTIAPGDIAGLLRGVKAALDGPAEAAAAPTVQEPAVPLRKLVTPDAIFCAECGKSFKSLKRHLGSDHNLTPDAYRSKWGLKTDSPMVAPNYSTTRSALAKSIGLGQLSHKTAAPPPPPVKQQAKPHPKPSKAASKERPQ